MAFKFNPTHKLIFEGSSYPVIDPHAKERFNLKISGIGSDRKELTCDILKMVVGEESIVNPPKSSKGSRLVSGCLD